jgi:hypothetical protein
VDLRSAQGPRDRKSVLERQHQIEDDHIVRPPARCQFAGLTIAFDVDNVPALGQSAAKNVGKMRIVLDDEDFHKRLLFDQPYRYRMNAA